MSKDTLYDKFKDSLDQYKTAYISYKTNPSDDKENQYFVSKQSLQNIYDKLISSKSNDNKTIQYDETDKSTLSYDKKKHSLNKLKTTLYNIKNNNEVNIELSSNRKSNFFYFLKREQLFLLIILSLFMGFLIYSRYELKKSYEITRSYIKKLSNNTASNLKENIKNTRMNTNMLNN